MRKPLIWLSLLLTLGLNTISANSATEDGLIGPEPIVIEETQPELTYRERIEQMASRGELRYVLMEVTAYCDDTITASGLPTSVDRVAAGPAYPFGAKMYVEGVGIVEVADRGGAVNNYVIDRFMLSEEEALEWGRQVRKVYILN